MAVVYLHVGMPKTGTSAVQDFLYNNREELAKNGVCYPVFGAFDDKIGEKRNAHWMCKFEKDPEEVGERLEQVCSLAERYPKVILSDEGLWNQAVRRKMFWDQIKSVLDIHGIGLKVIVCLRRQDDYVFSKWAQYVKADISQAEAKTCTFEEYMENGLYREESLKYDQCLRLIESCIGDGNIIVRPFEPGQFEGFEDGKGTVYSDFLKAVGEKPAPEYVYPEELSNISLSGSVLETRRLLNAYDAFYFENYNIRPHFDKVQTEMMLDGSLVNRSGFSHAERIAFLKQYEEGNSRVAVRYLGRPDGVLFYRPVGGASDTSGEYTTQEIADVCGRLMVSMIDKGIGYRDLAEELKERNEMLKDQNKRYEEKIESLREELRKPPLKRAIQRRFGKQ